jgi:hypothetical protein
MSDDHLDDIFEEEPMAKQEEQRQEDLLDEDGDEEKCSKCGEVNPAGTYNCWACNQPLKSHPTNVTAAAPTTTPPPRDPTATHREEPAERPAPEPDAPPVESPLPRHKGAAAAFFAEEAEKSARPRWLPYAIGIGALVLLIVGGGLVSRANALRAPAPPDSWVLQDSATGEFSLEVPANWHFTSSGQESVYEQARLRPGGLTKITIRGTAALGAMADSAQAAERIARGLDDSGPVPFERRAAAGMHASVGEMLEREDPRFRDEAVQEHEGPRLGAAWSYYTTRKWAGLGFAPIRGIRLTAPAGTLCYTLYAECPQGHWDEFEPLAWRIIDSFSY